MRAEASLVPSPKSHPSHLENVINMQRSAARTSEPVTPIPANWIVGYEKNVRIDENGAVVVLPSTSERNGECLSSLNFKDEWKSKITVVPIAAMKFVLRHQKLSSTSVFMLVICVSMVKYVKCLGF